MRRTDAGSRSKSRPPQACPPAAGQRPGFTAKTGANKKPRKRPYRTVLGAWLLSNKERKRGALRGAGRRQKWLAAMRRTDAGSRSKSRPPQACPPAAGQRPGFTAKTGANKKPRKRPYRTVLGAWLLSNKERKTPGKRGFSRRGKGCKGMAARLCAGFDSMRPAVCSVTGLNAVSKAASRTGSCLGGGTGNARFHCKNRSK